MRDEHLRLINQGLQGVGGATNFAAYVEGTYNTTHFPLLASTTQSRTRGGVIEKYLIPALGKSSLRDITPLRLQQYFASFTSAKLQHESVDKIRDVLAAILSTAVRYGLIVTNPIEGIKLPKLKRGKRVKPYVTPQQFAALVDLIPEPYATMVYVAVYTGLRISELCALKWENVNEFAHSITVEVSR